MSRDELSIDVSPIALCTPLQDADVVRLHSGDAVLLSGIIYGARDAAHQRMAALLECAEPLPFDVRGQVIYYVGPTPARPGFPIGSAGPTTASRMDRYTPALLAAGLRGMIGKGVRSAAVREAIRQYRAVYFGAVEGAAALLASTVLRAEVIAYPDLGPEAIYRLEVQNFPALVIHDIYGGNLYEEGRLRYCKQISLHGQAGRGETSRVPDRLDCRCTRSHLHRQGGRHYRGSTHPRGR
jgi:fumarate hydratase subunit beta